MNIFLIFIIGGFGISILCFTIAFSLMKKEENNSFAQLSEETKQRTSKLIEKCGDKHTLTREFMDKNNILMVLSYNSKSIDWKLYVLKDEKTNKCCFISSEDNKVLFHMPALDIIELVDTKYKYNEEKLVYTGATVGGITMGGFHVEGGDYSKQKYFTGKYGLSRKCYINGEAKVLVIDEIYLNSDLLEKAKDSHMKQYIDGKSNHILLCHKLSKETSRNLNAATLLGDASLDGAYNKMMSVARNEMSLTKEECIEIKTWLLRNIILKN